MFVTTGRLYMLTEESLPSGGASKFLPLSASMQLAESGSFLGKGISLGYVPCKEHNHQFCMGRDMYFFLEVNHFCVNCVEAFSGRNLQASLDALH